MAVGFISSADPGTSCQDPIGGFSNRKKKRNIFQVAIKFSFVAPNQPFFDRLETFSIARLPKITLVLLFLDENHDLPSLRASFGWALTQPRFSSANLHQNLINLDKNCSRAVLKLEETVGSGFHKKIIASE